MGELKVMDFMKTKLAEGKWNVHRMIREVSTQQGWASSKGDLVERAKIEPIIAVCYMVGEKMNKTVLQHVVDDCRQSVKPIHCETTCTPCYDFDWATTSEQAKNAWNTSALFCAEIVISRHVAQVNVCTPPFDRNFAGKDSMWFMKQAMNAIKHLLPPPSFLKVQALEEGTGWDDSLSDDDTRPSGRRRASSATVTAKNALAI